MTKILWDYPIELEKHSTNKIRVELVRHNAMIILTCKDTGINNRYMGYSIQEAKRLFRNHIKGIS